MLWRSFPHSASTRTPQPNKRQSVGAGRVGAIRRDHAARQCSAAHLGRVAALCTPCSLSGRLFTRCSSDLAVQLNKRTSRTKNACSITRTALLVHGSAGMISAGSRRGSSHALVPWNREQAWSASGPSGGHAFSGRTDSNRLNTEQQIGHASVTRSRTLVLPNVWLPATQRIAVPPQQRIAAPTKAHPCPCSAPVEFPPSALPLPFPYPC